MSTESETRLETLAEATEGLFMAVLNARGKIGAAAADAFDDVVQHRTEYKDALRAFLAPVVRIVEGGLAGQALVDEEFKCQKCGASKRCELDCADWHATLRAAHETADETFPICPVCDCPDDPSILCCEKKCPRRDRGETA
jgi:hypothetical protein